MRDFSDASLGIIRVAALLVAESPKRRQRSTTSQSRKSLNDAFGVRPREKIIVQLAALCSERKVIWRFLAEIEIAAPGVVEEDAVSYAFAQPDEKWKGLVNRVTGFPKAEFVGVPIDEREIAPADRTSLVAETVVIFVSGQGFPGTNASSV